jgi:hypothetical protein
MSLFIIIPHKWTIYYIPNIKKKKKKCSDDYKKFYTNPIFMENVTMGLWLGFNLNFVWSKSGSYKIIRSEWIEKILPVQVSVNTKYDLNRYWFP